MTEGVATFDDWAKLDLRVAEITGVEEIFGSDKLWKLTLDVGALGERVIAAGIKQYYSKDDLLSKKIVYFSNLAPRTLKGVVSQGMLLAASAEDKGKVVLISPESDIANGSSIG